MFGYLISFHYYGGQDLDELARSTGRDDLTFFADSGAFSAHTLGKTIALEEYAGWLDRWSHRIHAYASLDVLFDHEGTIANTQRLRALGLDPMPVFHLGSPLDVFKRYLEETPYVGVGGIASGTLTLRDPRLLRYLDQLHGMAKTAGVGLHGFGLSSWPVIRRWPWRSIDSSTPGTGYRYGRIQAYDPYTDRWFWWGLRDRRSWHKRGWLVREYGMAPEDFVGENTAIREALIQLAARSWSRAAKTLRRTEVYVADTLAALAGPEYLARWDGGNTWSTDVYIADPPPNERLGRERIAMWEQGNRWTTEVYVTDGAFTRREHNDPNVIACFDRGNRWDGATAPPQPAPAAPGHQARR